ncbi:regulator of G-protein signaling 22 isoform X2 [Ascaphus truei]|uniref:regulator of G-protein signaling 22 isoform X2 n=1 Tax=Ascaphus truei TaxID=8439 RepID=UPI003F59D48D
MTPPLPVTMRGKSLATGHPDITEDVFEDFLATDDLLVDYFNEFLCLPTFSEAIKFNKIFGIFEVENNAQECLKKQMKKVLREQQPPNPIYDATRRVTGLKPKKTISADLNIDNNYTIMCLNREQAVQWIKRERLPAFLKSDCYFEYRLAKLMSQIKLSNFADVTSHITPKHYRRVHTKRRTPSPAPDAENQEIMWKFFVTHGQASFTQTKDWFTIAKQSQLTTTTDSFSRPIAWGSASGRSRLYGAQNISQGVSFEVDISNSQSTNLHHLSQKQGPARSGKDSESARDDEHSVSIAISPCPTPIKLHVEPKWESGNDIDEELKQEANTSEISQSPKVPVFLSLEEFSLFYVDHIIRSAVSKLTGQPADGGVDEVDIYTLSQVAIHSLPSTNDPSVSSHASEMTIEEESIASESDSVDLDTLGSWCDRGPDDHISSRKEFERFKLFLKGTSGEKLWWLWIDIERLKAINDIKRQQSHLNKMKKLYLVRSEDHYVNEEVLLKLELLDSNQWNINHLRCVQAEIVKPLLLYWGPRFCLNDSASSHNVSADLKLWSARQLRPKRDVDPFAQTVTLLPLRPKSCMPRISTSMPPRTESSSTLPSSKTIKRSSLSKQSGSLISASLVPQKIRIKSLPGSALFTADPNIKRTRHVSMRSYMSSPSLDLAKDPQSVEAKNDQNVLEADILSSEHPSSWILMSSKMEAMLQALHLDSRAGYFFTHFCEQSGNKLWKNCIYLWFDLQSYHHMFYQETLQPFKLCRYAQSIFGTYMAPSASLDIGAEQFVKTEIYQKLDPPFEDLFDSAEEYILTLLLSAWIQMTESDKQAYGKVELVEETRQLDSMYCRKLQALQQEKASGKDEDHASKTIFLPPPDIPKEPNLWEQVPEEYRNYNLGTLIRHRMELEHFRTFLDDHFASMDLICWIDLEQFRRMPHEEKEKRQEKSRDIKNKYLNKKNFFGPNSPATREQQEQVMQLAGGWGKILHDRLSPTVLIEIQKYVRMRIEKKWLPMFLATEEYRARQKVQAHIKDVAEDVIFQTNKKKMGVWQHLDSKWISSSKEIIVFRKALLNPVTASQFQRFLSLKGDFLENGLLFWHEVQKYKDLCHSHCDDSTIQSKITAVINCFINSSIPPALQIDIPPEQAEKIMERRRDLGPYVFQEAQMTIFSIMFKFWPEFCEFRSNMADEKILSLLERKKMKDLEQLKRKIKEEEKRAMQQKGKRKGSLSDFYGDSESTYSGDTFSRQDGYGRGRNVAWSYSKYVEALEQERMLLKIQEDLQKKTASSFLSDNSSIYSVRTEASKRTGKTFNSSNQSGNIERISSALRQ